MNRLSTLLSPDAVPRDRFIATAICGVSGLAAAAAAAASGPLALVAAGATISFITGGWRTLIRSIAAVREGRADIDVLMIVAALASAALGHWGEGAVLLFLFSLSDALERYVIERTHRGIRALMKVRPAVARVVADGGEESRPIGSVSIGESIRIRPGERLPLDGVVIDGRSSVDESIVTGESLPVEKAPGAVVLAGTMNDHGSLLVRVTKRDEDSTIARIVRMVESAQASRASAQRIIEQWQTPYVLAVLGASALSIAVGMIVGRAWVDAIRAGMVLLIAASPCAVVLASPVAVLAAVTRGARAGVLFKGGAPLEQLAKVNVLAFDKTGTLTTGKLSVVEIRPLAPHTSDELLGLAAALESRSEHPIARPIVAEAQRRGLVPLDVTEFRNIAGVGVCGRVGGQAAGAGRPELFAEIGLTVAPTLLDAFQQDVGQSRLVVAQVGGPQGVIGLSDVPRAEAGDALARLRRLGVTRQVLLTGDRAAAARGLAARLGLTDVRADLRPEDKCDAVASLASNGDVVAMIGDGVNDAPALARASVGLAMGGAGADVAMETADVVLMRDDLHGLADAVTLARLCRRTIRTSLIFAATVMAGLVIASLAGLLSLPAAVVAHEGTTVIVIFNGLGLLGARLRPDPIAAADEVVHPAAATVASTPGS